MAMRTAKQSKGKIGIDRTDAADYFRFLLRMPKEMAVKIDGWAKEDFSPMNAYILRMLRDQIWEREAAQAETEQEPRAVRRAR